MPGGAELSAALLNDPNKQSRNTPLEVRCYFVRHRNALVVRAEFSPLYTDYYLHHMQHGIRLLPEHDLLLKDGLAALTLHLASRPWNEASAFTINLQDPLLNLFVTGSNRDGTVVGRVFTKEVKQGGRNLFFCRTDRDGEPDRQSTVEFQGTDMFEAVEHYYRYSEQRPARYFHYSEEDLVMVSAQPDCDMPWFLTLDDGKIQSLDEEEELSLLETRMYRFECGCDADRIYPIIASLPEEEIDAFFDQSDLAVAICPRCGARLSLSREGLETFLESRRTG